MLETVNSFKYLGRVLTAEDKEWPSVVGNLKKVRNSWARLTRILGQEGGQAKGIRDFFQNCIMGGVSFRVVDVGSDPPHETGPGKFSTQGCMDDHG